MTTTVAPARPLAALVGLLALLGAFLVPPAHAASGAETTPGGLTLFTSGHIDAFNVSGRPGDISLNLKEDVTGHHVTHDPASTILGVTDDAWEPAAADIPAIGAPGYVMPLSQNHSIIWPGWDSLGVTDLAEITYSFEELTGPGSVFMWTQSGFDAFVPRLNSGQLKIASGDTFTQTFAAHEHINWLFTDPGVYTMTMKATVTFTDGSTAETNTATYTWAVGTASVDKARAGELDPKTEVTPEPVTFDDENLTYTVPASEGVSYALANGTAVEAGTHAAEAGETVSVTATALDGYVLTGEQASWSHTFATSDDETPADPEEPTEPEDPTEPVEPTDPTDPEDPTESTEPTDPTDPADPGKPTETAKPAPPSKPEKPADPAPTTPVDPAGSSKPGDLVPPAAPAGPSKPANQSGGGAAPAGPAAPQCIPTEIEVEGEPTQGAAQVSGSHTVPANTHVHPNWVFTKAGTYTLTIRQTAEIDGQQKSATGTITFIVGGEGNANEGHFDVGTAVVDGELSVLIKDDRSVPAAWVDPSTLTFGLTDRAKTTAPAGIEFVANEGDDIWMSASSQVGGVPWVGANTQHESLGGSTPVTWELVDVSGPGKVAVFESGNFSQLVGARWFDGAAGATETGTTTQIVGRTADGQECELDSAVAAQLEAQGKTVSSQKPLAHTGASVTVLASLAGVLVMVGYALRRRSA